MPARLLPLSVDMLILVGELMLLHEADTKGRRFVLGWVLVWSGILATLAANVAFGAQFGAAGAVIWGWPAYSFVLAAWGMVAVVKRATLARETEAPECSAVSARSHYRSDAGDHSRNHYGSHPGSHHRGCRRGRPRRHSEAPAVVTTEDTPEVIPEVTRRSLRSAAA